MIDQSPPEEPKQRPLNEIAAETVERYRELFVTDMLPGVVQQSSNTTNTLRLASIFARALPENPDERQRVIDACMQKDSSVADLEGAFSAYQSQQERGRDRL